MAAAPPPLPEEILLRLPPDDPACLLRASLLCKAWGCAVSRPHFRRRLHELHRAPPVLGFLHGCDDDRVPHFTPTTASSFSLAAPDSRSWRALDCRHGRALFLSKGDAQELLLWEPTTGAQQRVPVPFAYDDIRRDEELTVYATAAVFCAADGCDHRDCFRGPFGVLFVFCVEQDGDGDNGVCVTLTLLYSSETDCWDELRWIFHDLPMCFTFSSSVLVGRSLLYFMSDDGFILEYDLARHRLAILDPPNYESIYDARYNIMLAEDGGLGVSQEMNPHLKLWTRVIEGADDRWVLSRVIYLQNLLPDGALMEPASSLYVLGFAEGANVIFMTTVAGLFTIELPSERGSTKRRSCFGVYRHGCSAIRSSRGDWSFGWCSEDCMNEESVKSSASAMLKLGTHEVILLVAMLMILNNMLYTIPEKDDSLTKKRVPPISLESTSTVYGHGRGMLYEAQETNGNGGETRSFAEAVIIRYEVALVWNSSSVVTHRKRVCTVVYYVTCVWDLEKFAVSIYLLSVHPHSIVEHLISSCFAN
ncbi:uncharacterized protein [Triticum aestivum]|uniref:uncharacterized protein isoform X1 n=1 Tax=Triticum aestivum TaxID=4565 RepID=UPI001D011DAB|nr:uncharacterized protein LOC123114087 isoform X1 [Triticum aestivum]